jgi:predicted DCC family thiol-disulfide oxidoreductase YuxK
MIMDAPERRLPAGQHLLLYDGVCGLCNRLVRFVLPRDPAGVFHYAALQSELGRSTARRHGQDPDALDTFYVVSNYRSGSPAVLRKGRAALFVVKALGAPWSFVAALGFLPDGLLNAAYDLVATRRYRIFGRYDTCMLPSAKYRDRFDDADSYPGGERP